MQKSICHVHGVRKIFRAPIQRETNFHSSRLSVRRSVAIIERKYQIKPKRSLFVEITDEHFGPEETNSDYFDWIWCGASVCVSFSLVSVSRLNARIVFLRRRE